MIDTQNTKDSHYLNGSCAFGTGPEVIVVLGSCRVVPYVQYLHYLNADNRFTIHLINVVNFYYDEAGNQVDPVEFSKRYEDNLMLLSALKDCKWFIHEHTANFGMFNTERNEVISEKNIYQFGMAPAVDISIPNFNNTFVLFQEFVNYDADIRNQAAADLATHGELDKELQAKVAEKGFQAIANFLEICGKTSLPEFGRMFEVTWRGIRYFWTGNHVSNEFTSSVFRLMNEKFLHLDTPKEFWDRVMAEDLYATPCTPVTSYDVANYGLTWKQPVQPLQIP